MEIPWAGRQELVGRMQWAAKMLRILDKPTFRKTPRKRLPKGFKQRAET